MATDGLTARIDDERLDARRAPLGDVGRAVAVASRLGLGARHLFRSYTLGDSDRGDASNGRATTARGDGDRTMADVPGAGKAGMVGTVVPATTDTNALWKSAWIRGDAQGTPRSLTGAGSGTWVDEARPENQIASEPHAQRLTGRNQTHTDTHNERKKEPDVC